MSEDNKKLNWYHSHEGVYFARYESGDVAVGIGDGVSQTPTRIVHLPVGVWGSIVSTVSKYGETFETWNAALAFHNGGSR